MLHFFIKRLASVDVKERIELFDNPMDDDKKILIVIDLTDADDEQSIFDTINSAGMRLSCADIVKNVLFQKAFDLLDDNEKVKTLYRDNWESVFASDEQTIAFWVAERTLGRLKRDNHEILLHAIAVINGFFDPEKHTLTDLANIYKAYISNLSANELISFINAIMEYAKLYRQKIHVFDNSDLFGYDDHEKRIFHVLNVCDASAFHSHILYLYRSHAGNSNDLKSTLHELETLAIRCFVCNSETKNYNKLCKEFINDPSKLHATLAETSDDDFKNALQHVNNKSAALLLFWVELYRRHKDNRYDRDELKFTYTLEHIMPQKWEEYWEAIPVIGNDGSVITDTEAAKQYRYRTIYNIGNMTLLKSSLNTSLRNYEFKRKVDGEGRKRGIKDYAELGITKFDIATPFDAGDKIWDETKIRKRSDEIANDVLEIWC